MTVNTSLVRECLELILMLADALDRKRARPPTTVLPHSLPATPDVSSEHPPLGISDDEAGVHLIDGPRWPEAADRHDPGRQLPAIAIRGCIECGGSSLRDRKRVGCQIAV
jgi:hypothetical protein